jgi:hypothetical protein
MKLAEQGGVLIYLPHWCVAIWWWDEVGWSDEVSDVLKIEMSKPFTDWFDVLWCDEGSTHISSWCMLINIQLL